MHRQFGAVAVLSTAAAVLSLAGCGGSSTNPSSSNSFKSLPAAEQQYFESAAVEEITADVSSFTSLDPLSGVFFGRVVPHRVTGAMRMLHSDRNAPRFQTSCTVESGDPTDPDNDGVVNSDTTTANNCSNSSGGDTFSENGFFAIGDPTPNTQDLDISDAANLTVGITTTSDGSISLALAGSAQITQGTGVINLSGDWNINEAVTNNPNNYNGTFKLGANETASYSFSGTAPVTFGTLPEPGQFSVAGSWTYDINTTKANYNLSFTVTTVTPLTIDGCSGNPEGIDSGEVDIKFTDGTVVAVKWGGCPAQPSTTVS